MKDSPDRIDDIFEHMAKTGLVSTSNRWIEKASVQKNPKLTVELACSKLLVYDVLDKLAFSIDNLN
jgi:hypothetical protein